MSQTLVLTVLGDDRPGLVGELAAVIAAHDGNWLESSFSQLAGKFAGIVRVDVADPKAAGLQAALLALSNLHIVCEIAGNSAVQYTRALSLSLVGHDRIGIVKEVSQVLARHAVNVVSLSTHTDSAPMSSELMFHADIALEAGAALDTRALKADLEQLSDDLMVDVQLGELL